MISKSIATALVVFIASSTKVHAKFRGGAPSFLAAAVHSSPDHHHEEHAGPHKEYHEDSHSSQHTKHEEGHGHSASKGSATSVAMGLMAFVILTPVVMSMLMTQAAGGQVSYLTFRLIDMATSIFLAVLCFSAFGEVLQAVFPQSVARIEMVMALVLYVLTMLLAYTLREKKDSLFIFCGCAAHFIAFAAIQAAGKFQRRSGTLVEHSASPYMSFGFCIVLFAIFAVVSLVCFYSWRRHTKSVELNIAIDELELDIAGLVLSFSIMQALRHALSGHYPSPAHLFVQLPVDPQDTELQFFSGHGHSTEAQRTEMLMWSIGFTCLACLSQWVIDALKARTHYWMHKFLHVGEIVLVMCAAWGYLLWGAMQFTMTDFHGDKMYGNMMFAVVATVVSLIIILGLAFATSGRFSGAKGYARLCVMAVSLLTAWSWEHCFHTAINIVAEEYQIGYGGLVPKIIIATIVPLVVLPGYVVFLKPIVLEKTELFDAEDEETEHKDLAEVLNLEPEASEPPNSIN